ncbi:MAG: DNA-processing protein DprA [Bacilli bacterium]|nr:DNA-processing protein DprA [Bacilli bacterium]
MESKDLLVALSIRYEGDWDKMIAAIRRHEYATKEEIEKVEQVKKTCSVVTLLDDCYPQILKDIKKPPIVLYYYGDLSLIRDSRRCISYVGSRKASEYGIRMAKTLCEDFAKEGFTIVSGLAYGIDAVAAKSALPHNKAVAVLGNGINHYYPLDNRGLQRAMREHGLVLSEYPPDCPPSQDRFPMRNRIVAGLSIATVVGEASTRSGTLITVGYALEFGRDVLCVPYQADAQSACNLLIRDGASLIEKAEDLYSVIGYEKYRTE